MQKIIFSFVLLAFNLFANAQSTEKLRLMSLLRQTDFYITSGNIEKAADLCEQALVIFKDLGVNNDTETISGLHKISHAYSEKKMYSEAVKTESLLVEVFPHAIPDNLYDYALYLNDLALYLLGNHDVVLAEKNIQKALSLIKDKNDVNLAVIYVRAAEIYKGTIPHY